VAALMLVFMLPLSYTIINAATRREHYWLPVFIPLISCLVFLFPETQPEAIELFESDLIPTWQHNLHRALPWLAVALITTQFFLFIQTDIGIYLDTLHREDSSTSLAFTQKLNNVLSSLPAQNKKYVAYRDWHVYFPDTARWRVEMTWDITTEHFIRDLNPDLILFEQADIDLYNSPQAQQNAVNPEDMTLAQNLYQSAADNRLEGYQLVYRDPFGIALIRKDLASSIK